MGISASFLSIKDDLKNNIKKLNQTDINYLHLDIMDGEFVNNKTWNISEVKELVSGVTKSFDVHLMVNDVIKYIDEYKTLNPEFITFHLEAVNDCLNVINYLKNINVKVGIAIKPNTLVKEVEPYLKEIDLVLVMSVEPGCGGQLFINNTVNKINKLKQIREKNNYNYIIEVDGGINNETISLCNNADVVVVGSYITNSNNYQNQINMLRENV